MRKFSRRFLTMLLAAAMVFGLSGMTAFAAEAEESGIVPLTAKTTNDITVYKNDLVVCTIDQATFDEAVAEGSVDETPLSYNKGGVITYVTARFVRLSDLLDDNEPDNGCGVTVTGSSTSVSFLNWDEVYLYDDTENESGIRVAVDGETRGNWVQNVESITLGHDFNASGTCKICKADQSSSDTYNVKYAVTLWGIKQDQDKYNNTLGLTFGPATGDDYRSSCVAHLTEEEYYSSTNGVCLHWMSWDEIIAQSKEDPTVFQDCLEYGCTHSVNLNLNTTLLSTSYAETMNYGDGAGVLSDSIAARYRSYNSAGDTTGGWPASQVRAVLNGKDYLTGDNAGDALSSSFCLLSCFPSELQSAIVRRAVPSDTVYNSEEESDTKTTYDKLWLPSGSEVYEPGDSNNEVIRSQEGKVSQRSSLLDISTTNASALANYNEKGEVASWRLRSLSRQLPGYVYLIGTTGSSAESAANTNADIGLAPCFCLAGPETGIDENFYDVKYAVTLWGINHDVDEEGNTLGLTFGPATGKDYKGAYEAHLTEEEYKSGEKGVCLHWMSWAEIVEQSKTDPTAFNDCLAYGCTHAVNLALNDTLLDVTYADQMDYGDGVGYLYYSVNPDYRHWHLASVGWPESEARSVLNEYLQENENSEDYGKDISLLTCFPEVLQNEIVAKEVRSDTVKDQYDEAHNETTYDKLWYFSAIEMWGYSNDDESKNGVLRSLEGSLYERSKNRGITTTNYGDLQSYNEEGLGGNISGFWYTRSLNNDTQPSGIVTVMYTGQKQGYYTNSTAIGLAPGFCLPGPADVEQPEVRVTVTAKNGNAKTYDGEGVTLTATAETDSDTATFSYQWYGPDGSAISDATDKSYTTGANVSDSGTYKCVVTATSDGTTGEGSDWIRITITAAAQEISYADTALSRTVGAAAFTNTLTQTTVSPEAGAGISYKSSDTGVATVDANGKVTILSAGTTTITATAAATANYKATTASYTLTVSDSGNSGNGGNGGNGGNTKKNGLYMIEKGKLWGYYVDGAVDTSYTGFASNDNGDWYVVNGYIRFDRNTVAKDVTGAIGAKGTWYYVVGNKVQHNFTGLAHYRNANGWWYIKKGVVDFTHNGVDKNQNGWWYVTGGKVQFGFTGLAHYKNDNGWWYIKKGKVDFTHGGVDKNQNGWWYVTGGKVQFGFTGLAHYRNSHGWWYISGGKVRFDYNGIASNQNGTWYLRGGKVQFGYSGTVTSRGRTYNVSKGKVT